MTPTKVYDIFISHSSRDKPVAREIYDRLERVGYKCFIDEVEIAVGEDIIDRVFEGIRDSRFLLLLLSPHAVQSQWVRAELNSARIRDIESGNTVVLPAVIADCERPAAIRTKKYADLTIDLDAGMRQILEAMVLLNEFPGAQSETRLTTEPGTDATTAAERTLGLSAGTVQSLLNTCREALAVAPWREGEAFKDVLIIPVPIQDRVERADLEDFARSNEVRLTPYGGPSFPYPSNYANVNVRPRRNGLAVFDDREMPFRDWCFEFWFLMPSGVFFSRTSVDEDHLVDHDGTLQRQGVSAGKRMLAYMWALRDITRPLRFARSALQSLPGTDRMLVRYYWGGMQDRVLSLFSIRRVPFFRDYKCHDEQIHLEAEVTPGMDDTALANVARDLAIEVAWLFDWRDTNKGLLEQDLAQFIGGQFPRE